MSPPFWTPVPGVMAHLGGPAQVDNVVDLTAAGLLIVVTLHLLTGRNMSIDVILLAVHNIVVDVEHGDVVVIAPKNVVIHMEYGDVGASL